MIKTEVTKKQTFLILLKIIFFALISLTTFCWLDSTWNINGYSIVPSKILLGLVVLFINYLLVFNNFKKSKGFAKILFFIESIIFILVSLILIFHFFIKNNYIEKIFELYYIIYYIFITHSIVELYINQLNNKVNIISSMKFILFISLLSISCYLRGSEINLSNYFRTILGIVFLIVSIYYIYKLVIQMNHLKQNKKNINQSEEEETVE
ncbi:hypothetical protein [Columbia Basin potato purple top phytoplasma]|uniref:Uncharacterized protein n=1 Tax=Columbia Basin potato purple top phytoplasma TaxID=307134 RepID=A0ABT5LBL6_9MOLU|nr:hypothetical protein [Columbia Basin potato purple top phytoplasma]MDC9032072.1 hypothetical protein [Columbia Basin potato purple top phytoplasma]